MKRQTSGLSLLAMSDSKETVYYKRVQLQRKIMNDSQEAHYLEYEARIEVSAITRLKSNSVVHDDQ